MGENLYLQLQFITNDTSWRSQGSTNWSMAVMADHVGRCYCNVRTDDEIGYLFCNDQKWFLNYTTQ